MIFESFSTPESSKIERQQVVEALVLHGKEHVPSIELLTAWIHQEQEHIRTIENKVEEIYASIAFDIEKVEVYFDTGFWEEALEELEGDDNHDGLSQIKNFPDLLERVEMLTKKVKACINSREQLLVSSQIELTELKKLSLEQLQNKMNEIAKGDNQNFELAAQIRDEIKKREKEL